ncbi:zinc-ribbon domain-containing protein [Adlercreutzia faecimuris]|uniref:Zinc-ribbon domain-containing protein n=1 Tax=Adlercreutzia faecimuris TaxID=2897341 RepID=A0ABS9WI25_9ACTN|nr:zinc-ribbon domain-containing protein [Adlercreutzia sp. JBNU-10]MCI2242528.1 hypothetical protein [Adlercreutzia sp. JBNU-10]
MSKCGYACMNCGQCRGVLPKPILVPRCVACGHENPRGSRACEACGASLELRPGVTNTIGKAVRG